MSEVTEKRKRSDVHLICFALCDFLDPSCSAAPIQLCIVYRYACVGSIKEVCIFKKKSLASYQRKMQNFC